MRSLIELLPTFALSLALTLIFELLIALLCRLRGRDLLLVVLVNILTNPAVVYLDTVCGMLLPNGRDLRQIPLELAAIAVEALCYARFATAVRHPWMFALAANVFSYGCGLLIQILL